MALFSAKETSPPKAPARGGDAPAPVAGTFLGQNLTVDGTISGSEAVVIEGTVKGQINLTGDLRIGSKARVDAKVHAMNVTIEGKLNGDVSADDRVELVASAVVDGNIKAPKVVVADGAKFHGAVDMGSAKPKDAAEPPPAPSNSRKHSGGEK